MSGTSEILEAFVVCVFCVCAVYGADAFLLRSLSCAGYVNIKGIAKTGGWIAPFPLCSSIGNSTCLYLYRRSSSSYRESIIIIVLRAYIENGTTLDPEERPIVIDRFPILSLSLSSLVLWQLVLRTNGRPSSYLCVYIVTNVTIRPESNCQSLLDRSLSLSLSL
jgi:hypothetical protein